MVIIFLNYMSKKRIYCDYPYLLTTNTKFRREFFRNFVFAKNFAEIVLKKAKKLKCKIFAFQTMPDHSHIIMQSSQTTISKYMQQAKSCLYHDIKTKFGRTKKFWQKGFDFQILQSEEDIFRAVRYLANNPVKACLNGQYFAYPYAFVDIDLINKFLFFSSTERQAFR